MLFDHLLPIPLDHFLNEQCISVDVKSPDLDQSDNPSSKDFLISIAETMLLQDRSVLKDPNKFYNLLLGAFIYRAVIMLPDKTRSVDALMPLLKVPDCRSSSCKIPTVDEIRKAIKAGQGSQYLGIVKVQIKTGAYSSSHLGHLQSNDFVDFKPLECYTVPLLLRFGSFSQSSFAFDYCKSSDDQFFYFLKQTQFTKVQQSIQAMCHSLTVAEHKYKVGEEIVAWVNESIEG
ncbi:hypothetical protein GEMRC1_008771 [Eukaryota sp. GEM-RC1]